MVGREAVWVSRGGVGREVESDLEESSHRPRVQTGQEGVWVDLFYIWGEPPLNFLSLCF